MSLGLPDDAFASLLDRAKEHARAGRSEEAATCYRAAVQLEPRRADTHYRLGRILEKMGRLDAACAALTLATQLEPDFARAHFSLAGVLDELGRRGEAIAANRRALQLEPGNVVVHNGLVYRLHFVDAKEELRGELLRWRERHSDPLKPQRAGHANSSDPERPLKIGYVSDYFRQHATAFYLHALLSHHDRRQVHVVAYSGSRVTDEVTGRFRALAHEWRDIAEWDDARVAEAVREDGIDILVDLMMHLAGCRLGAFARKPAPVQATWVAYPGSTGMDAIDYRLSDRHLDPALEDDRFYAEETVRLPDSFWCYDPLTREPAVEALPALAAGHPTFGCLNDFRKLDDATLTTWARILRIVPGARLLLLAPPGSPRTRVRSVFGAHGVTHERIECVVAQPRPAYLATYHRIDVALDPFPFSGHTTLCDALWMGVPTVTLCGPTPVARGGASLLRAAGLPQLIAATLDDYVRIAVEVAADREALSALRAGLRARVERAPLMDGARFARNMEGAYRGMWRRWCAGAP